MATPGTSYVLRKLEGADASKGQKPEAICSDQDEWKEELSGGSWSSDQVRQRVLPRLPPFSRLFSLSVPPIDGTYQEISWQGSLGDVVPRDSVEEGEDPN